MGYINLLKKNNMPEKKREEFFNIVSRSIKKLYDTNNNLIQIALKDDESSKYVSEIRYKRRA